MSIKVNNLTKTYGKQKAVDNISLSIKTGEIVGLLGPNGAGKTTIMKILSCYIPPNEGKVEVCKLDVLEKSLDVRKKIGYLPETNPLYHDMYIREYLRFIAGIYKIKNKKQRISEMIDITGLAPEQHKKISDLSKGYRQRVGLAQAMIHNPEVLILDEPTSGLDPNQIVDIRDLIIKIGKKKTVLLSTHIMQEVEAMCDRVIIIDKGKIVADDTTENLHKQSEKENFLKVEFDKKISKTLLQKISGVNNVKQIKDKSWEISYNSDEDIRTNVFNFAVENKIVVLSMNIKNNSLENVFRKLTQHF